MFRGWLYGDFYPRMKYESNKAKLEARQKQNKTKMATVNKKLKFVILQQVNVILLLFQILASIETIKF